MSAAPPDEPAPSSFGTAFVAAGEAIADGGSGHTTPVAAAGAWALRCALFAGGTDAGAFEGTPLPSCALERTGPSAAPFVIGAGCCLTESVLTCGEGEASSLGATDGSGASSDGAADAASGTTCGASCGGWSGARKYQHLRCLGQSMR
ncbi:MAG TPA: hypothetical protein VEJ37_08950 [Xanthobacteraceae bacterium]|nr:hypothetical protein [Xanthobacteraceae bacterium]